MRCFRFMLLIIIPLGLLVGIYFYVQSKKPSTSYQSRLVSTTVPTQNSLQVADIENISPVIKPSSPISERSETNTTQLMINHDVPFTSQAPTADWDDDRQQDGCEEASAVMAMEWVRGEHLNKEEHLKEILALSDYEQTTYGEYRDITLADITEWVFKDYFKYNNIEHQKNINAQDIINALYAGHIVLVPMNGQKLGNPYFTSPGPERHMILIRGYDPATDEFITNDPGTKRGENYRYKSQVIMDAILVYPTGYHVPADETRKEIIVVKK